MSEYAKKSKPGDGRRDNKGLWKKGVSGNPSGQKKQDPRLINKARGFCEEILDFWVFMMRDTTQLAKDRIKASENIYDRAYGKPQQGVELESVKHREIDVSKMTDEQIDMLTGIVIEQLNSSEEEQPDDEA